MSKLKGSITLAADHRILVNGAMVAARAAAVGDELSSDSGPAAITEIKIVREPGMVHIFVQADSYYARDPEGGAWLATGNLMQFGPDLWNKAKECYATGHYMPSYDPEAGWDWPDLHGKPCDEFPAL